MNDRLKLLELGFIVNGMITKQLPSRVLENVFSILKQRETSDGQSLQPEKWIISMNTPEKLSLFLSHFSNYDINEINPNNEQNILDQLIHMQPYLYSSDYRGINTVRRPADRSRGFTFHSLASRSRSELLSHPNDIVEYRAVRIVTLIQQLVLRGARVRSQLNIFPFYLSFSYPNQFVSILNIYRYLHMHSSKHLLESMFSSICI